MDYFKSLFIYRPQEKKPEEPQLQLAAPLQTPPVEPALKAETRKSVCENGKGQTRESRAKGMRIRRSRQRQIKGESRDEKKLEKGPMEKTPENRSVDGIKSDEVQKKDDKAEKKKKKKIKLPRKKKSSSEQKEDDDTDFEKVAAPSKPALANKRKKSRTIEQMMADGQNRRNQEMALDRTFESPQQTAEDESSTTNTDTTMGQD